LFARDRSRRFCSHTPPNTCRGTALTFFFTPFWEPGAGFPEESGSPVRLGLTRSLVPFPVVQSSSNMHWSPPTGLLGYVGAGSCQLVPSSFSMTWPDATLRTCRQLLSDTCPRTGRLFSPELAAPRPPDAFFSFFHLASTAREIPVPSLGISLQILTLNC